MTFHIAQLNIAKFSVPQDDPINADFVNNLDKINAIAESQPGFIWRFTGDGNDAMDIKPFEDPNIAVNMSVWESPQMLANFVYANPEHKAIMRRRTQWFDKMKFYMVLWWVEAGTEPTIEDAKLRLALLEQIGPSYSAFTFSKIFAPPTGEILRLGNPNKIVPINSEA